MRVKEESEKAGLKLSTQKTKIMASGPITSWQIDGEKVETVIDFTLLGSKITVDGDCSHEIKRHLLLGRIAMTNLVSILKIIDITLPTNIHIVKATVLSVIMYGCESCTIKKVECWRCFRILVLEKTLESPLDSKEIRPVNPKGNQLWKFIGWTDSEFLILWPADAEWTHWKNLDAGKDWLQEEKGVMEDEMVGWHHWLHGHWVWANSRIVKYREAC